MGAIGGSVFHAIKGFRYAPSVSFSFHIHVITDTAVGTLIQY